MNAELWQLTETAGITDVLINGTTAWIDRGSGMEPSPWAPGTIGEARALAVHMAAAAGKRLDDAAPIVDGFLGETIRLHAVLPPLAKEGPLISLRVLRRLGLTLADLVHFETLTPATARWLEQLVAREVSVLISGATGSGKTTLLAALLGGVPADQRIVCIEEVSELFPRHPHVVHLQERRPNIEGEGAITLAELVRAAMRMRPDRMVLGECRGAEVREVLTALNTGHGGGMATIHANSVADTPARLQALAAMAGMGHAAVATHGAAAFQVVLQLRRTKAGRRLAEIGMLTNRSGELLGEVAYSWEEARKAWQVRAAAQRLEALVGGEALVGAETLAGR